MLPSMASAATWEWAASSGTWATASNWNPASVPTNNTADVIVNLSNGGTATLGANWQAGANSGVTVGSSNTLNLQAVVQLIGVGSYFTNNGTVQATSTAASLRFSARTATNSGIIQANDGSLLTFWDSQNVANSGTIQAKTGGTIRVWGSGAITGGQLKSETGGTLLNDASGNPNQTFTLTGVTVSNAGTFTTTQTVNTAAQAGTITTTLATGTVFTNAVGAVTEVRNAGDVVTTTTNARAAAFNVNSGATFTNAGTLLIQNDAARTGSTTSQAITFTIASGATAFTNTGTIKVVANTTAAGATATFTSAKSITNDGVVHIKGNASSQFATFSVTGTGNDYTQSAGSGRRTVLEQGGALTVADQVIITGGTLGGIGTITGATTIGGDATLVAGETLASEGVAGAGVLAFNSTLTLANDSEVKIGLGLNTAGSGRITLAGASNLMVGTNVTLTLSDLTAGNWVDGTTYRLFDLGTGTINNTNFSVNLIPSGWAAVLSSGAGGTDYLDVTLNAVANVPEPSAYAALGGATMLLWALGRRRRSGRIAAV